jgi:hypothetical protein
MLKYAVKEDYENSKTEINLISIDLEYNKPDRHKMNKNFANLKKMKAKKKQQN